MAVSMEGAQNQTNANVKKAITVLPVAEVNENVKRKLATKIVIFERTMLWHDFIVCPSHKYGAHCLQDCKCQNDAKCDSKEGTCECTQGWFGIYCDKPCVQGKFGKNCIHACPCESNNVERPCDIKTGECFCKPGYTGDRYVNYSYIVIDYLYI